MTTELINLTTKHNGKHGYRYYQQKYGDRFVYIGCKNRWHDYIEQSIWCNPHHKSNMTTQERKTAVELYRKDIMNNPELLAHIPTLRGKVLACWCAPALCHGHVLLELVTE